MAQIKTFSWTNPSSAVARKLDCGFVVAEITTVDTTNGGSWYWNSSMASGSSLDVDSGAYSASNGVSPLAESAQFGPAISGFTNANPGVITVGSGEVSEFGIAAGDTIKVTDLADDQSQSTSLNGSYTVASVSNAANTITLDQNTTSYSVYVSGGTVVRVSDTNGDAVPTENKALRGVTVGTTPVGGNSAAMVAVCKSAENVT